jgi:anti-sigma regulatory factor (Ser/Thr protein kinase)/GNAT superfamily N-acetyltransferase
MEEMSHETQLAKLSLIADKKYLPLAMDFIQDVAVVVGLEKSDAQKLELIVEEASLNVIEHAFDEDEKGNFEIIIMRKPGQLVISIRDKGLPFDFLKVKPGENSGLGMVLMKALADEIHYVNRGREGKEVIFVKNLPYKNITELEELPEAKEAVLAEKKDVELTYRLMTEQDAVPMARCMYRSYGYSYGNDFVYYPEKVQELIKSNLLHSCVVFNSEGELIGHLAMMLESPDAKIGETGMAVVDPRYRGHGIFKKTKLFLIDYAKKRNMAGIYSEAVAVHPYTQKGNISLGAHETGFLIGFTPSTMFFKKIETQQRTKRQTTVLFYLTLKDEEKMVYPPFHHKAMIKKIYEMNGLKRKLEKAEHNILEDIPEKSQVDVRVQTEPGRAFMRVSQFGKDVVELIGFRLHELCLQKIDCIYIDLPLSHPMTQQICAPLEMMGFFFAGIIPEMFDGDVVRLQYLNNVDIDFEKVTVVSDFGNELFDYVVKAHERELSV